MREALWANRAALMELALESDAGVHALGSQNVIETWDRAVAALFLRHGADPVTGALFARAFNQRVKACPGPCRYVSVNLGAADPAVSAFPELLLVGKAAEQPRATKLAKRLPRKPR